MNLKVLAVTDEVDPRIYSTTLRDRMGDIDFAVSCGDLPATYLEYLTDALHKDVYYVLGNHAEELVREGQRGVLRHPLGCIDLGFRIVHDKRTGIILVGLPGSPKYLEHAPVQYTEQQMMSRIIRMIPRLLWNRIRHGRFLDLLVTHSPPRDVGDREDPAHRGFKIMRRFIRLTRPRYHLHGHVHIYDRSQGYSSTLHQTQVINVYPFQKLDLHFPRLAKIEHENEPHADSIRAEMAQEMADPHV